MQNQSIMIRPFEAATDVRALSGLWLDASLVAHGFLGVGLLHAQQRLIEETYLPMAETWVAEAGTVPVGFVSLLDRFIGGIFVAPDQQGRGIGRALISHALARKGALTLEVYTRNTQATRFYAGLGFREVSRREVDDNGLPFETALLEVTA
ncbi:GNAT family N-acetyltransferase [Pseudotabrizicola sp. 4114]|uniref:GNAT family N-acetyltransferase n=1 Tax=Pseudotabrizicola sp. 4114 TaxID=2817731 RepID=UPI00285E8F04|nr:ribosomal protein S18 acetylase RimI-like enzyme [Pseudorhodobacter sp. 4114]